jgi:adenylylsulfate kinase
LSIATGEWPIEDCVDRVIDYLRQRNVFSGIESGGG